MSRERQGWFADIDDEITEKDGALSRYRWQPCLQLDGLCLDIDIHFRTRSECEEFIRDEITSHGWLPGEPTDARTNLLRHARAHAAFDKTMTHGEGKIVAYCEAPQYLIEREDGSRFWWRADLTEVTSNPDSTRRNNE